MVPPPSTTALSDPTAVFLNQAALKQLQLPGNPIGRSLNSWTIQGVYKNFNFQSLDNDINGLGIAEDTFPLRNRPNSGCMSKTRGWKK